MGLRPNLCDAAIRMEAKASRLSRYKLDAIGHCALAAFARALAYQVALKVGIAASSVDSKRPCELDVSHSGSPSERNAAPALADALDKGEQFARRAAEAVRQSNGRYGRRSSVASSGRPNMDRYSTPDQPTDIAHRTDYQPIRAVTSAILGFR